MGIIKSLNFVLLISLIAAPMSWAHGSVFHSLVELEAHISKHLEELRTLEQQQPMNKEQIREECHEIQVHAEQYQQFAQRLIEQRDNVKTAQMLSQISKELYRAAGHEDFFSVIRLMAVMQNLLRS